MRCDASTPPEPGEERTYTRDDVVHDYIMNHGVMDNIEHEPVVASSFMKSVSQITRLRSQLSFPTGSQNYSSTGTPANSEGIAKNVFSYIITITITITIHTTGLQQTFNSDPEHIDLLMSAVGKELHALDD